MTGSTPAAGAPSHGEGGPGAPILQSALSGVIGLAHGATPAGLALTLDPAGNDVFLVRLVDAAGENLQDLGPFAVDDVIAVWRSLGAASGLPLQIQRGDGRLETPYPQIGRVQLGTIRTRRRHGLLGHRRPRFLTRRKPGAWPLRPRVHRERENLGQREG
ncbi:MAG TPA: DUF6101 family protein [Beijerinckiaceae bacterium]